MKPNSELWTVRWWCASCRERVTTHVPLTEPPYHSCRTRRGRRYNLEIEDEQATRKRNDV
jgi:hypothetical protein